MTLRSDPAPVTVLCAIIVRVFDYLTQVPYPTQFNSEQTPAMLEWFAASRGEHPAQTCGQYADLGSGPGVTVTAVAALNVDTLCTGYDVNPEHQVSLMNLASDVGLDNVQARCTDFAALLADDDFSPDIATARGVLSWIPPVAREQLAQLFGRVGPGGLVSLGFDTLPGQAALAPLHDLARTLRRDAEDQAGSSGFIGILNQIVESRSPYLLSSPTTRQQLRSILSLGEDYVMHDLGVPEWRAFWVDEVVEMLAPHGLRYVGSVAGDDQTMPWIAPELAKIVESAPDIASAVRVQELLLNPSFRSIVFRRAPTCPAEIDLKGGSLNPEVVPKVGWVVPPTSIDWKRNLPQLGVDGEATEALTPSTPGVTDMRRIPELLGSTADIPVGVWSTVLIGSGYVQPLRDQAVADRSRPACQRFNRVAVSRSNRSDDVAALVAPDSGAGVQLGRTLSAAIAARRDGSDHMESDRLSESLSWWSQTLGIETGL